MRNLLFSVFVLAGLTLSVGSSFAGGEKTDAGMKESTAGKSEMKGGMMDDEMSMRNSGVVGEVTDVQGSTIKVADEEGITRSFSLTGDQGLSELSAQTIEVGDKVYVQFSEQGREVSINKISQSGSGTWMDDQSSSMMEDEGSGAMMEEGESGEMSEPPAKGAKGDFDKESRTPAETR